MRTHFCDACNQETELLDIKETSIAANVCRRTVHLLDHERLPPLDAGRRRSHADLQAVPYWPLHERPLSESPIGG